MESRGERWDWGAPVRRPLLKFGEWGWCFRLLCHFMNPPSSFPYQYLCIGLFFLFFKVRFSSFGSQLRCHILRKIMHCIITSSKLDLSFSVFSFIGPYFCFIPYLALSEDYMLTSMTFVSFTRLSSPWGQGQECTDLAHPCISVPGSKTGIHC